MEKTTSDSFVHWSNMDDLVKYAEEKPAEVSRLWSQLYDEFISVSDKIERFRKKRKLFNKEIALDALPFGTY